MVATLPTSGVSELLGEIVTWDMDSTEVSYAALLQALEDAGLPKESANELRPQTAFRRAVKDLKEGRTIDRMKVDSDSGLIHFQFTKKHLNASGFRLDFAYEALCTLSPETGTITCDDSPEIEAHARTMFSHAIAHRNTSDVTRLVQRLFAQHADLYPINPKKGVAYFVPNAHRAFSAQVEDLLSALGGRLLRFPVPRGTPEGNRAVKASVEDGLRALAAELESAVEGWDESTRESTFERAIEKWQTIKHKAEAYSEYLGDRQESLLATLAEAKARLAEKVAHCAALKEAKAAGAAEGQKTFPTMAPAADPAPYAHVEAGELPGDFLPGFAGEIIPDEDETALTPA